MWGKGVRVWCDEWRPDAQGLTPPLGGVRGFRVRGEGLRVGVWGLGFQARGFGFRVSGFGLRFRRLDFGGWGAGFESYD